MELPAIEFVADDDGFVPVAPISSFSTEGMTAVSVNGTAVIFVLWQDKWHAYNGRCPHASARLMEGEFYKGKVICPDHGYCFSAENGRILWPSDEVYRLKRYAVRQVDGVMQIQV